jgi:hypothetical protein
MIVDIPEKGPVRLPDFLIVGAAKSGTSSLYHYLRQHPRVFMPANKEPWFFFWMGEDPYARAVPPLRKAFIWRLEDYIQLFSVARKKDVLGEASVAYLACYKEVIDNIKSIYGEKYKDLKIVIILRNPVDRAFSNYLHAIKVGRETLPFSEAISPEVIERRKKEAHWAGLLDYLDRGMYFQQVKAFTEEFPLLKVCLFEDLQDSDRLVRDLFQFLGVDTDVKVFTNMKVNPSGVPRSRFLTKLLISRDGSRVYLKRILPLGLTTKLIQLREYLLKHLLEKPELPPDMRAHLIKIYKEDVLNLERILGHDLSHWLENKEKA